MKKQILFRLVGLLLVAAIIVSAGALTQSRPAEAKSLSSYLKKYVDKFGAGSAGCTKAPTSWSTAYCGQNALMRFATDSIFAKTLKSSLDKCYWKDGTTTGCYYPGNHDKEVRFAGVSNSSVIWDGKPFAHFVAARFGGVAGQQSQFYKWTFYQYDDLLIHCDQNDPDSEWQMPPGTDIEKTKVTLYSVTSVNSCSGIRTSVYKTWYLDKNCDVSTSSSLAAAQPPLASTLEAERVEAEMAKLEKVSSLQIGWWMTVVDEKQIHVIVAGLTPENQKLNGMRLGDWEVKVWEDQLTKRLAAERE